MRDSEGDYPNLAIRTRLGCKIETTRIPADFQPDNNMTKTLGFLLLFASAPALASIKDDRVSFSPGSQMVGELKRLERGRLYFKTDATDQIPIDWQNVTQLISTQQVQVELTSGIRYLGRLTPSSAAHLAIQTNGTTASVPLADVVRITPIEETFRERWDVDLSAGYRFTKASDIEQLNFGVSATYTTERRRNTFAGELIGSDDSEGEDITRWTVDLGSRRLRNNRWFTGYTGTLESNDGLDLDLRTSLGVGIGRSVWQTNTLNLGLIGGILASREEIAGVGKSETTIEGLLAAEFELFRYAEPEIDLTTGLNAYPNLSDWGRIRLEYDLTLRWELLNDFFWELKFYDSFDSDPVAEDSDRNDYGIVTGVVWDL